MSQAALRLATLVAGLMVSGTVVRAAPAGDAMYECGALAAHATTDKTLGPPLARARLLERYTGKCSGTGAYDTSLASFFERAGLYAEADRAAKAGLVVVNEYRPNLLNILALNQLGRGNDDAAYKMGLDIARQYPRYPHVYYLLGQIDSKRKRWDKAHEGAKRLVELDPSALSYMTLATSQYQLKRYDEVVNSVGRALELEPERISSPTGLTEGIYALILLNRRQEARELLRRHMLANRRWSDNLLMLKAARELGVAQLS